jgi:uncharacterized protein (TIGR03083 family)
MADDLTRSRLLEQMRAGRAAFESLLAGASDDVLLRRPSAGDWSVKDVLAHVSCWDRHILAWLHSSESGRRPDLPRPAGLSDAEVDEFNAANLAAFRDRPLADVLAEFRASFADLLASAESLPEDALLTPGHFDWTGERPLWFYFAANSFWHYAEHEQQVRSLV